MQLEAETAEEKRGEKGGRERGERERKNGRCVRLEASDPGNQSLSSEKALCPPPDSVILWQYLSAKRVSKKERKRSGEEEKEKSLSITTTTTTKDGLRL